MKFQFQNKIQTNEKNEEKKVRKKKSNNKKKPEEKKTVYRMTGHIKKCC